MGGHKPHPVAPLETYAYYALGIPFYFVLIGSEVWLTRRQGLRVYAFSETLGNVGAGLGEIMVGFFLGPYLYWLYCWGYEHLALIHWPSNSLAPWLVGLLLADFCYYLYHRAGHAVAALWAIHGVHHQAEEMNVTVAMRHPWFSDLYSALFYVPLPLLGIPPLHFFCCIAVISFYALVVHTRAFQRSGFSLLVTPASHLVHHARNPRYLGKNLGAMFTIWDRLFGTHVDLDPDDPPVLGTRRGYQTHSGALSQWVIFGDLWAAARQARNWRDRLGVFLRHPGWLPAGVSLPPTQPPPPSRQLSGACKVYVSLQYLPLVGLSGLVMTLRDQLSPANVALMAVFFFWGQITLGGLLDGRSWARSGEAARILVAGLTLVLWRWW